MRAHVSGGTNAGWRDPFCGRALPWQCRCLVAANEGAASVRKTNPGYLAACPTCNERRPS